MHELSAVALFVLNILRDGQDAPLAPGEALREGDRFAVTVKLREARYVYVAHMGAGGLLRVLSPSEGDTARTEANAEVRLPAANEYLTVPALHRDERLCFLCAGTPVSLDDGDAQAESEAKTEPPKDSPPPKQEPAPRTDSVRKVGNGERPLDIEMLVLLTAPSMA